MKAWRESLGLHHGIERFTAEPMSVDVLPACSCWRERLYEQEQVRDYLATIRVAHGSLLYAIAEAIRWQCPGCGQALFDGQAVHRHHRIPVHAGGDDTRENLHWLHATCHHQRHQQGITAGQSA